MSEQETTADVIAFKQRVLQEAPASARSIEGVDKIFYMREPGIDATLSGSGTVTYREGWGVSPRPTRYGGVLAADKALRLKGFRPYNIFTGGAYQMNEARHKAARADRQAQQKVFQHVELPKATKGGFSQQRYGNDNEIGYPTMDIPTNDNMIPRELKPQQRPKTYFDLLQGMKDPVMEQRKIKGLVMRQTFDDNQFAAFANQKFSTLKTMERQLGITPIRANTKQRAATKRRKKGKAAPWKGKK